MVGRECRYASDALKGDRKVVLAAVATAGAPALDYAAPELHRDARFVSELESHWSIFL
eukprot:COSAG05_NODE_332_length_11268_cov_132.023726_12_plen_58_part_00